MPTYGQDPYRRPERHTGRRFRFSSPALTGVPSVEVYRPCAKGTCSGMPAGLKTYEPPYPVAVVVHGFTASKELHRMNTQAFAEAGYLAIGVNGTWPNPVSAPNSSSAAIVNNVLKWLATRRRARRRAPTSTGLEWRAIHREAGSPPASRVTAACTP